MRRRKTYLGTHAIVLAVSWAFCSSGIADETRDVAELKRQLEALRKKVDALEAEKRGSAHSPRSRFQSGFGLGWDPFSEMDRMRHEMDQMFQDSFWRRGFVGKGMFSGNVGFDETFDLKETDDGYEMRLNLTGLDEEKIDIQIEEHSITVKGERSRHDAKENPSHYFRSESYGSFVKTMPLPNDADASRLKTWKEGNMLIIKLPKKET
jgi:HSP20 family protein